MFKDISVRPVESIQNDLKVVNAARVSMAKNHDVFDEKSDTKLINYLAKHRHWTPFSHVRFMWFVKVPSNALNRSFRLFLENFDEATKTGMIVHPVKLYNDNFLIIKHSLFGFANIINQAVEKSLFQRSPYEMDLVDLYLILKDKVPVSLNALLSDNAKYQFDTTLDRFNDSFKQNRLQNQKSRADFVYANEKSFNDSLFDITLVERVPIFVARQRFKHVVGVTYNEVSRRYVDSEPKIYLPESFRNRPDKNIKQGSGDTHKDNLKWLGDYIKDAESSINFYNDMIKDGIAPEQARMVLPQSMMTEYYVTANLQSWERFLEQRLDTHAQKEIQSLAQKVKDNLKPQYVF